MEVYLFTRVCLILLATDCIIKSATTEKIYVNNGSNATLLCPWSENSVKWYGIFGHQYSLGKSILSGLSSSLRERLDIWENNGFNLRIRNVSGYDEGNYRCSSTNGIRNIMMYLIVPPTDILFEDLINNYITGDEDQPMNITCRGIGGHPPPNLLLSNKGDVLATTDNGTLLYTMQPSRTDDRRNYSCSANHSELIEPLSVDAVLYLNLKTESVRIESFPILYELDVLNASCFATGGRPPTSFEWSLLGEYYNSSYEEIEKISLTDTYNVKSVLSLQLYRQFDKSKLICRGYDKIDKVGITRSLTLEIYYPPSISIIYQNQSIDDNIRTFVCKPHGNPIIYKFNNWEHHSTYGEKIRTLDKGLDGILTIPELDRTERYQDNGIYTCFAENGITGKDGNPVRSGSVLFVSEGHPHISIYNPYKQFCKLGSAGSLVVKYTSWPPPLNITWFKYEDYQNIKLQESKRYTMTETPSVIIDSFHDAKIHVDGYVGILYIDEVTLKDLTNFTVKIHNKFGQESFTFFLSDMTEYQAYCRSRRKEYKLCGEKWNKITRGPHVSTCIQSRKGC